jgi:hypothetical protein
MNETICHNENIQYEPLDIQQISDGVPKSIEINSYLTSAIVYGIYVQASLNDLGATEQMLQLREAH